MKIFISFFQILRMSVIELVKQKIQDKPVFVISKEYCPFCVKAKDALREGFYNGNENRIFP